MERDNLVVDLSNYQGRYDIFEDYIELSNNRYTYINNILTITSVEGEIYILYKDISEIELVLRNNDENNQLTEDLVGGMYRYQGTDGVNNWICFGTTMDCSKTEEDIDKYMYRIIGVTDDGQLELIKMTALNDEGTPWNNAVQSSLIDNKLVNANIPWSESDLYKRLNGLSNDNLFINSDIYDYMQKDSIWYNKIADTNWLSGALYWVSNWFELENIYQIETGQNKVNYYEEKNVYDYNNGNFDAIDNSEAVVSKRNKDGVVCEKVANLGRVICYKTITKQFDESINSKIGIMHLYDFDYAVQKDGFNCFSDNIWDSEKNNYKNGGEVCKASWMHLNHNDNNNIGYATNEWTIARNGFDYNTNQYLSWFVTTLGNISDNILTEQFSARPVFYLTTDITLKEGTTGEKNNPYIIDFNACHYDGELSPGVTFINNDYTYRYMQEGSYDGWQDIDNDGWGVMLTDKESTKPVNSELCSSINGKPIVSMSSMFASSQAESIDVSSYDTSNVTNMTEMFSEIEVEKIDVSNFNTSSVTDMSSMFSTSVINNIIGLNKFDTSNVTTFENMFSSMTTQSIDISNWNFDNANSFYAMYAMFNSSQIENLTWNNYELTDEVSFNTVFTGLQINNLNIRNWRISSISDLYEQALLDEVIAKNILADNWDITAVPDFNMSMLISYSETETLDISNWKLQDSSFLSLSFVSYINKLIMKNWDATQIVDTSSIVGENFVSTFGLKTLDLSGWKFNSFFLARFNGEFLENLILDNWDLSEVTSFFEDYYGDEGMFFESTIPSLNLSTWDVSHIENFKNIFKNAYISSLDISTWDIDYSLEMFGDVMYDWDYELQEEKPIGLSYCHIETIYVPMNRVEELQNMFDELEYVDDVRPEIIGV